MLALWQVSDPGNVGTLLRTADAFGAGVSLSPECADPTGPRALRASAGAIFRVPLVSWNELPERRVALVAHGGESLAEADLEPPLAFLLGSEREGLPESLVTQCHKAIDSDARRRRVAERRRGRRDRALRALAARAPVTNAVRACHHASVADWERPEDQGVRTIGERVRSLRRSAGLSQEELAAGRFSKEYVSQIERGKTRPTPETLEWIAGRLDTDREFLEHGVSKADAERARRGARGGRAPRRDRAVRRRAGVASRGARACRRHVPPPARAAPAAPHRGVDPHSNGRARAGDVAARGGGGARRLAGVHRRRPSRGRVPASASFATRSRRSARRSSSSARRWCSRTAPSASADRLRSDIFHWRARCHRRNRDWVAAAEDIERALELADASADARRAPTRSSRRRSSRSGRVAGCSHARTPSARGSSSTSWATGRPSVASSTTSRASSTFSATRRGRSRCSTTRSRSSSTSTCRSTPATCARRSRRSGSRAATSELSETQARKALDLLGDRVDHLQEVGHGAAHARPVARGAGQDRGCGAVDRRSRRDVRARTLGRPSQLRLDRAGRRREPTRRRPGRGRSLSARGARAAGRRRVATGSTTVSRHVPWRETGVEPRTRCR